VANCGLDLSGSGHEPVEGPCEHGNEPLGSVNCTVRERYPTGNRTPVVQPEAQSL